MDILKKEEGKVKKGFKKFWFLLWKDNSIKGWLFSLVFLFVFIKLIFFPLLNLATGTSLPLAIVESCSMYHQGNILSNFNEWFGRHETKYDPINITKDEFQKFKLDNGFSKGDILFIVGANPTKLKIGDIIVFSSGTGNTPVIHRIINIKEENGKRVFTTMGDNNAVVLVPSNNAGGVDERTITESQLIGKASFRLAPGLGWIKLIFFEGSKPVSERGLCSER
jgi:signal peptidase I